MARKGSRCGPFFCVAEMRLWCWRVAGAFVFLFRGAFDVAGGAPVGEFASVGLKVNRKS